MGFTRLTPVQSSDGSGVGAPLQATSAFALAANETVVAGVKWETSVGTATVTDTAGNTWVPLTKVSLAVNVFVQLFYCLNTTANAANAAASNAIRRA